MGALRRTVVAVLLAGLIAGLTASTATAVEPCLGIDANGDGEIDSPPSDPDCVVVPFAVEPEKNNIVDIDFINTHAAVLWTPSFDPALVRDVPLCFGDADNPSNRACTPVTKRGKFRDVNGDGHLDHIWKWPASQTGIQSGDTSACIYGQTSDGRKIEACDSMTTVGGPGSTYSVNDVSVVEGSAGTTDATFTVSLSPARTSPSSVSYATVNGSAIAPGDYQAITGQLTFDPGETSKIVNVPVSGDTTPEADESFTLQLFTPSSGSTIGDGIGVGTILTDDAASVASIGDVSVTEGNSGTVVATFTVSITPPSDQVIAVSWATTDGTAVAPDDYQADAGTLNLAANESSKTIAVLVNGDTSPEASEAFAVDISSSNVSIGDGHGVGTILNDDSVPSITISDVSLPEGNSGTSTASFVVTLSNPSAGAVTVSFATADGTAKAPGDYFVTSGVLSFAPGEVSQTIPVTVKGDMLTERDETFFVNLTNASGATVSDPQGRCVILTEEGLAGTRTLRGRGGGRQRQMRRGTAVLCALGLFAGAVVFLAAAPPRVLATAAPAKPNIVLILSDDQSLDSLAAMPFLTAKPGGHWFEFTKAFDNTPLCCPSRATLLSGLYPHHHGVEHNTGGAFDDDSTIATWLQAAGYRTGLAGKYLNDYPFGSSFIPPGWSDWFANVGTAGHYNYTMNDNGTHVSYGNAESDYHTDVVARRAKEFIETSAGQPFFLYAAPIAPHPPLIPPPRHAKTRITTTRSPNFNEADVSDKPAWVASKPPLTSQEANVQDANRAKQYRMVMAVDDLVRTVRQALADTGVLDDTVIIFQTDNGSAFGEHRLDGKSCVYEECVRTPLFVRVPWLDGGVDDRLVSSIDIAPTVADLAGIAPPDPVDGTSLRPLLEGAPESWRSSVLLEHHAEIASRPDFWAIRTEGWKYVELVTGERELYDLVDDRYEMQNVAGAPQHADLQATLAAELAALRTEPPHDVFPAVSISGTEVLEGNEGSSLLEFTMSLSVASLEGASVRASTVDGTASAPEDYQSAVETFTFGPDETEKTFLVTVNGDATIETDETVGVVLDQLDGLVAADGEAAGTIMDDDDVPAVSVGDVTIVEGDEGFADATFTLSLSHTSGGDATVAFTTADGSAVAPDDYEAASGEVTFEPGQLEQDVTIRVAGDAVVEPDETFTIELSAPSGAILGDATGTALILDDDVPVMIAIDDVTVTEGNGGTTVAVFTVSLTPASTDPIAVSWSTADGTAVAPADFAQSSGTLTFAPGETSKTIPVQVVGDVLFESQETFVVDLTSEDAGFTDAQGLGTINDDDLAPSIAIADVVVNEGTGSPVIASFVVTLSAPSGAPVSVQYVTANGNAKAPGDYGAVSGTLLFSPGETSKTIEVVVVGDSTPERTETFFVNLSSPVGATLADTQGRCSILNDD